MRRRCLIVLLVSAATVLVAVLSSDLHRPFPSELLDRSLFVSTTVIGRDGSVLHGGFSPAGTRSDWIDWRDVPPVLERAVIAVEDHRFHSHGGIDLHGVVRAVVANLRAGAPREGASTITQQTVKLLLQSRHRAAGEGMRPRTITNKIEESVLALRLERTLTKQQILELWLNLAPFGGSTTGVRRASRELFDREPRDLTLAEAALLAGIPKRPAKYDPRSDSEAARQRRDQVLRRMRELGLIAKDEYALALQAGITLVARDTKSDVARHAVSRILERKGNDAAQVEATIDPELQRAVKGIIEANRRDLDRHGARAVAVVVLDNESGEWLAWEGSGAWGDARREGSIDGVVSPRQPGSALKPFVYAAAFEQGYTPATVLADVRSTYPTAQEGVNYVPVNYDLRYRGPVRARVALAASLNVPAVQLTSEIGVPTVLRTLRAASITTLDAAPEWYGLGVSLGGGEVRLDELTAAYAAFPRGGSWIEPTLVRRWQDASGAWHRELPRRERRVFSEGAAWMVSDILADPSARAITFGRGGALETGFPVAVKTGTSQSYRDNWTIGYTARITVGVWVGNFDRAALRSSSGVTGAAPIFHDVMIAAEERYPSNDRVTLASSAALRLADICSLSGGAAGRNCPSRFEEWVPATTTTELCSWHTPDGVRYPGRYDEWRASHRGERRSELAATGQLPGALSIAAPADGSVYLYDPTLRSEFQTLALRADGAAGSVAWFVNGKFFRRAGSAEAVDFPLRHGLQVISVRDSGGRVATSTIVVR